MSKRNSDKRDNTAGHVPENQSRRTQYRYTHQDRKKSKMLKALSENMGIVKYACMDVGISRQTHYRWLEEDQDYTKKCELIQEDTGDYVEKKLLGLVRNDSEKAILFYAETKLKDRGYFKKNVTDATIRTDEPIDVTLDL